MTWGLAGTSEKLYRFIRTKSYEMMMEVTQIIRAFIILSLIVKSRIVLMLRFSEKYMKFIRSFIIWNIAINNCWLRINSYVQNSQWWYMVYISHGMHKLWCKGAEFFLFYWLFPHNVFWSWFPTPVLPDHSNLWLPNFKGLEHMEMRDISGFCFLGHQFTNSNIEI